MGCLNRRLVALLLLLGGPPLACFQDEGPGGASGGAGGGSGGGSADPCASYAAKVFSCDAGSGVSQGELQAECDMVLETTVGACRDAYLDVFACYADNECAVLSGGQACQAEVIALSDACFMSTSSTCTIYGQRTDECDLAGQDEEVCQAALDAAAAVGAWCATATEDLYACRGELACSALKGGAGCDAEALLVMIACDGAARPT